MVTGRELPELKTVFPDLPLFDVVIAENGALLYRPDTGEEKLLGPEPPPELVQRLRKLNVTPMSIGRSIIATWEPHQNSVLQAIHDLGVEYQVIFNKGAVMILPSSVNKASGLAVAHKSLRLSPHQVVGIGDAENDNAFLMSCGCAVAVANALPSLKSKADIVTKGERGAGVQEIIDRMIADDLGEFARRAKSKVLAEENISPAEP
jgi:HAD superfamily hydrolase (TIGR01484 family)